MKIEASVYCDKCLKKQMFNCYKTREVEDNVIIVFTCQVCSSSFLGALTLKEWEILETIYKTRGKK